MRLGDSFDADLQVRPTDQNGTPVLLFHPDWVCGAEGMRFAKPGVDAPRRISTHVLLGGGKTFACGFFDLESMRAIYGPNVSVGICTFTELARHVGERDDGGERIEGIVLSPGLTDFLLDENDVRDYLVYVQDLNALR